MSSVYGFAHSEHPRPPPCLHVCVIGMPSLSLAIYHHVAAASSGKLKESQSCRRMKRPPSALPHMLIPPGTYARQMERLLAYMAIDRRAGVYIYGNSDLISAHKCYISTHLASGMLEATHRAILAESLLPTRQHGAPRHYGMVPPSLRVATQGAERAATDATG